jgi:hypothetical protein
MGRHRNSWAEWVGLKNPVIEADGAFEIIFGCKNRAA